MCYLREKLGPDICRYCPPADKLICPKAPFSDAALKTLGRQQGVRFLARAKKARAFESHPESPSEDFRPTEWTAQQNFDGNDL